MALSIGIVGLPNVGKSTLFNALTKAQNAQAANYPFCTIEPNKATVAVPDKRVDALTAKAKPQKTIHASVDFIDIAGLVRGASKGEGLGNQFLANIRECAAIVEVVRCFEDENITHVDGAVDPLRDIDTIETELLLADIQSVEKRLEKLLKMAKGSKDAKAAAEIMQQLLAALNDGKPASTFALPENEAFLQSWRELGLLTAKPVIYCANVDENAVADGNDLEAREHVAFGNTLSGIVMNICSCTAEHSLEHAMSAYHHDLPHGAGLIMISKAFYEYFIERHACDERFVRMAQAMGMADASKPEDFITMLVRLQEACGVVDLKMSDYGIKPEEFDTLAKNARETMGGLFLGNPCELDHEGCVEILRKSYK